MGVTQAQYVWAYDAPNIDWRVAPNSLPAKEKLPHDTFDKDKNTHYYNFDHKDVRYLPPATYSLKSFQE